MTTLINGKGDFYLHAYVSKSKPSPDDDAISIGPDGKDGRPKVKLGKDEMRTAGTAKKAHGYNGKDLTKCLITEAGAK